MQKDWNPSRFLWNVAQSRSVLVGSRASGGVTDTLIARDLQTNAPAAGPGAPEAYKATCMSRHDDHMMRRQRLTRAQWEKEIDKMTGWGAPVNAAGRPAIVDYLAACFKP